jgi:hypothetical protein
MLRELGSRAQRSYAAIREPHELVVAQRFVRQRGRPVAVEASATGEGGAAARTPTPLDGESMALMLREARCLARNGHPNIARIAHVDLAGPDRPELTIATELVDGATLADLFEAARPHGDDSRGAARRGSPPLALPVLARILLDVLTGLHALHHLRDSTNAPLGALHGAVCPANVVVGKDGIARIVNVLRPRPVHVDERSEALGYAAPEALDESGTEDPRADVFAVGAILWEGLVGRPLHEDRKAARVAGRLRGGDVVPPSLPPDSPFLRLTYVVMRALAFDPALRFQSVADMGAELRKVAGARLATGSAVAACVRELAGDSVRMRRALLDPAASGTRRRAAAPSTQKRSGTVKASPRKVAPTVRAEVPLALLAASRSGDEPFVGEFDIVDVDVDDDDLDEPPGPRGRSPELDLDAVLASPPPPEAELAPPTREADHGGAGSAALPAISPLLPNVPLPQPAASSTVMATTQLMMAALAAAEAEVQSAPPARGGSGQLASTGTPGDFVIPIEITDTLHEGAAPRQSRRGLAFFAAASAVVLLAMGSFVALRAQSGRRAPAAAPVMKESPPPPTAETAPPEATAMTAITTSPTSRAAAVPRSAAETLADAGASAAAAQSSAHAPPNPPPAKPKKSLYEPDGL